MSHRESSGPELAQKPEEEKSPSTFFCRALFDYQADDDDCSISFRKGDIIEVLRKLESGWWGGFLGQQRGWFPSNYVTVISNQEAGAATVAQPEPENTRATLDNTHNTRGPSQDLDRQPPIPRSSALQPPHSHGLSHFQSGIQPHVNEVANPGSGIRSSDFWVPQVSVDGRVSLMISLFQFWGIPCGGRLL
jgi:son of sevenless-like protein